MNAVASKVSATKTPDSPVHNNTESPCVKRSKTFWMMAFHVECKKTAGQMLPVAKRKYAITYPKDVTEIIKRTIERRSIGLA